MAPDNSKTAEEEIKECYEDFLETHVEAEMMDGIKTGNFGAVSVDDDPEHAPDGYYIVKWTGEPYFLTEPAHVEGFAAGKMDKHTIVCQGQYLNRVPRNPLWYQQGDKGYAERELLFRVQYVLDPKIKFKPYRKGTNECTAGCLTAFQKRVAESRCFKVTNGTHEALLDEKRRRAAFDVVEGTYEQHSEDEELQAHMEQDSDNDSNICLLYTSPSPRDQRGSRMPSSA